MRRALRLTGVLLILSGIVFAPRPLLATIPGIASGIPEPAQRNVIVQLFNWPFQDITRVLPQLKTLGYSHIHISSPQRSNEVVWQWWGRYQPIDLSVIAGPLGSERDFQMLNEEANRQGIQVLVDVVFNHTVDITELPEPNFVELKDNQISSEKFPQFEPMDFHRRCRIDDSDPTRVQQC